MATKSQKVVCTDAALTLDTAAFTVDGKALSSYKADVDTDADYTPDTEAIEDGAFMESKHRSAPYFDLKIDGIKLLDTKF